MKKALVNSLQNVSTCVILCNPLAVVEDSTLGAGEDNTAGGGLEGLGELPKAAASPMADPVPRSHSQSRTEQGGGGLSSPDSQHCGLSDALCSLRGRQFLG